MGVTHESCMIASRMQPQYEYLRNKKKDSFPSSYCSRCCTRVAPFCCTRVAPFCCTPTYIWNVLAHLMSFTYTKNLKKFSGNCTYLNYNNCPTEFAPWVAFGVSLDTPISRLFYRALLQESPLKETLTHTVKNTPKLSITPTAIAWISRRVYMLQLLQYRIAPT